MSVQWTGLQEFKAALRNLPAELTEEAGAIVMAHTAEAERLVNSAYPEGPTGNLKRGVRSASESSRFAAVGIVKSTARHAHLFERGTGRRQTRSGANRGAMPAAPESQRMIPIVIRVRRRMTLALIQLLQRAGFQVEAPGE